MGGAPTTVTFRGVTVDPGTGDALAELARISGDDIYVAPIPGFGSYRTNAASGGTDTGGGHCDLNAERLTDTQARRLETAARSLGFVAYFRPRISPYSGNSYGWQRHVHLIRRDCTDLSWAAREQVKQYDAGWDGLAVPHKDTGSRAYVGMTWAKYLAAKAAAPIAPEDDMFSDTDRATLARIEAALNAHDSEEDGRYRVDSGRYQHIVGLIKGQPDADAQAIADAIPADLAQAVANELGKRLNPAP